MQNYIAEIFNLWSKSQFFRREETNFISANEIDNMALIMPTSTRRTVVTDTSMQTGGKVQSHIITNTIYSTLIIITDAS